MQSEGGGSNQALYPHPSPLPQAGEGIHPFRWDSPVYAYIQSAPPGLGADPN